MRIRVNITKALANTKDSQAVYPLLYCLNSKDEHYKVKLSCADALGKIGDRYAVLPLMNIVEDESEASVYVKESAVSALGMIGDEKAVDSLVSILESKKGLLDKFTFWNLRAFIIKGQMRLGYQIIQIHTTGIIFCQDNGMIRRQFRFGFHTSFSQHVDFLHGRNLSFL